MTALASGAERSVCAAVGRSGWGSRQRSSPKFPSTSDDPSVAAFGRDSSLCAREPLALRGGGRTHRSAPTRSSECTATPGGAGQSPPTRAPGVPICGPMQASAPTKGQGIQRRFAPRNNSSPPPGAQRSARPRPAAAAALPPAMPLCGEPDSRHHQQKQAPHRGPRPPSPARSGASAPVPGKVQEGAESPFLVSASGGKKQNHFSRRHVRREKFLSRSDVQCNAPSGDAGGGIGHRAAQGRHGAGGI